MINYDFNTNICYIKIIISYLEICNFSSFKVFDATNFKPSKEKKKNRFQLLRLK